MAPNTYQAQVLLQSGLTSAFHARPIVWIASKISGLDASIVLRRNGRELAIDMSSPTFSLMIATAELALDDGSTFEIECSGPQGREAFRRLHEALTTGYFEGGSFIPLHEPTGPQHA